MSEERIKILEMLQNGIISVKEANDLLATLDSAKVESDGKIISEGKFLKEKGPKFLYIRILSQDGDKVNVTVPISLVKAAIKSGGIEKMIKSSMKNVDEEIKSSIDLDMLISFIENGEVGNIVDIESADGDKVNIYIE